MKPSLFSIAPVTLLAALFSLPVLAVLLMAIAPDAGEGAPLADGLLWGYGWRSVAMAVCVGALASVIGIYAAWCVTLYDFPLRRVLQWALLLPLAVPSYLSAMAYGSLLDVSGDVQRLIRESTGLAYGEYWFPDIRSFGGAVLVLSFALYPYVYAMARVAFGQQCHSLFDAARLLRVSERRLLWRVALPVARPAIIAGTALVMMESLADYGTVSLFGVSTLTTGITRLWYGMGDPSAAARLAAMIVLAVLALVWLERHARRHLSHHLQSQHRGQVWRRPLTGMRGTLKLLVCGLPVVLGFVVPVTVLLRWHRLKPDALWQPETLAALADSLMLMAAVVGVCLVVALVFAYALRGRLAGWVRALIRLASCGYATPGAVIALGVFIPLIAFDHYLADSIEAAGYARPPLLLTGSMAAVVLACAIRFMAVALGAIESAMAQMSTQTDDAARLLGASFRRRFMWLHVPALRYALLMAGFMVASDTLKELPASFLLRPFDMDTLAIRSFELASNGRMAQASAPALMLVALSLLLVLVLGLMQQRATSHDRP